MEKNRDSYDRGRAVESSPLTPDYQLIDIDQMEPSIVRRRLRRWTEADAAAITPLIAALQDKSSLSGIQIQKPRYETNVYPLYYYWSHTKGLSHTQVYARIVESFQMYLGTTPDESLIPHIHRLANTEIDILIEDCEYFVFVEAKNVPEGKKPKFETTGGVHQLVRQYLQGKLLEKVISKTFALATIDVNSGSDVEIELNDLEARMLNLVGVTATTHSVVDLLWP